MGVKCGRVIKYSFRSWELIINFPLSLARSVVLFFIFNTLPRFSTMSMKFVWVNFRVFPPTTIHSLLRELCSVVLVGWLWWTAKARATTRIFFITETTTRRTSDEWASKSFPQEKQGNVRRARKWERKNQKLFSAEFSSANLSTSKFNKNVKFITRWIEACRVHLSSDVMQHSSTL